MTPTTIILLAIVGLAAVLLPIALVLVFLYRIEAAATEARLSKQNEALALMATLGKALAPGLGPGQAQIIEVTFAEARAVMAAELVGKSAEHDFGYRANLAVLLHDKYATADLREGLVCNRIADDAINMLFGTDDDGQRARSRDGVGN